MSAQIIIWIKDKTPIDARWIGETPGGGFYFIETDATSPVRYSVWWNDVLIEYSNHYKNARRIASEHYKSLSHTGS